MTNLNNEQVLQLATELHGEQKRSNGQKYITHPIAVATLARYILETCYPAHLLDLGDHVVQAAYLHDVLEDCDITEDGLLVQGVNENVVQTCVILNKNTAPDYYSYIITICELDLISAAIVKYADLLHNSNGQKNKLKLDRYNLAMALLEQYYLPIKLNSKYIHRFNEQINQEVK
jgi:(p)ppGpp synthase/HD superfamily hydrolase